MVLIRRRIQIAPNVRRHHYLERSRAEHLPCIGVASHVVKLDDLPGPASGGPVGRLDHVRRHVRQRISEVRMLRAEITNLFGVHRYVAIRIIFH